MPVTARQANAVLRAVKTRYRGWLDPKYPEDDPKLVADYAGHGYAVVWEAGPFEWAMHDITEASVNEELTTLAREFQPSIVVRDKPVTMPAGVACEPWSGSVLSIYED
jgi:hypothetical protein